MDTEDICAAREQLCETISTNVRELACKYWFTLAVMAAIEARIYENNGLPWLARPYAEAANYCTAQGIAVLAVLARSDDTS